MIRSTSALSLAFAVSLLALMPAQAQSARVLGDFRDWSSYATGDGSGNVCFALTKPKSSQPAAAVSGEAYLYVTNRPGEDIASEINLVSGYTFQTGSMATLAIGGQNFALFTQGDAAWLDDAAQTPNVAAAIRAGSSLSITGTAADGTTVIQNFSLSGATAAQQAIGAEC